MLLESIILKLFFRNKTRWFTMLNSLLCFSKEKWYIHNIFTTNNTGQIGIRSNLNPLLKLFVGPLKTINKNFSYLICCENVMKML